eukprot:TRINITY_DN39288_c0_g1_i1.p2 TRINITY_DN39288_c0_g1~~TRINITY_DN39288_c0_g1_i1.p2  ORF type:complete len:123 (-),score=19.10 TRINITY_DN39288_c0_g1_i1:129-497(-)
MANLKAFVIISLLFAVVLLAEDVYGSTDGESCIDRYKTHMQECSDKQDKCVKKANGDDHKEVDCDAKATSCERAAYRDYKNCKYYRFTCHDWCDYNRSQCFKKGGKDCNNKWKECDKKCKSN